MRTHNTEILKAALITLQIFSLITVRPAFAEDMEINDELPTRITRAVDYLLDHYNSELGLIYESEDEGTHWLKRIEYPEYSWGYNQTYWLYSDNLVVAYALEPWAPEVSMKINETINRYQVPKSNKFEVLIGEPIGPDRGANNIIVVQLPDYVILIRCHDGILADPRLKFVDSMIYEALTKFYQGQPKKAREMVMETYGMWNGTCLVDYGVIQKELTPKNAPSDIGYGMNFKLALLLYGAKVTGTNLPNYDELEEILWSKQQENGGITTLSTTQGEPIGSANTETTALTLLIYNEQLISRLQNSVPNTREITSVPPLEEWSIETLLLVILGTPIILIIMFKKKQLMRLASSVY